MTATMTGNADENIRPMHFGRLNTLFGICHHPSASNGWGVVICNPLAEQAIRAHGTLKNLSVRLCRDGFHVLRFDYSNTGNSGDSTEGPLISRWLEDVDAAIALARSMPGVDHIALIGLRFGAALAGTAALKNSVDRLVLWDPQLHGKKTLEQLANDHKDYLQAEIGDSRYQPLNQGEEALGLPLTQAFKAELADFSTDGVPIPRDTVMVLSRESSEDVVNLSESFDYPAGHITVSQFDAADWDTDEALNMATLPVNVIAAVVDYLSEGVR